MQGEGEGGSTGEGRLEAKISPDGDTSPIGPHLITVASSSRNSKAADRGIEYRDVKLPHGAAESLLLEMVDCLLPIVAELDAIATRTLGGSFTSSTSEAESRRSVVSSEACASVVQWATQGRPVGRAVLEGLRRGELVPSEAVLTIAGGSPGTSLDVRQVSSALSKGIASASVLVQAVRSLEDSTGV